MIGIVRRTSCLISIAILTRYNHENTRFLKEELGKQRDSIDDTIEFNDDPAIAE